MVKPTGPVPAPDGQAPATPKPALRVPLSRALTLQLQQFRRKQGRDAYKPAPPGGETVLPEDLPDETLAAAHERLGRFDQAVSAAKKRLEAADQQLVHAQEKLAATQAEIASVQKERQALGEKIGTLQHRLAEVDRKGFQLAEKKADLLVRIADREAKLGVATDAEFQLQAQELRTLRRELAEVRGQQAVVRAERVSVLVALGQSVSGFLASAMVRIATIARAVGTWLYQHMGPLRGPADAVGKWGPIRGGLDLAGRAWKFLEDFFGSHGGGTQASELSDRERAVLERLSGVAAKALEVRKQALATGRAQGAAEDREVESIVTQEATVAQERKGLTEALASAMAMERQLEARSRALADQEREARRQVEGARQARDQAERQYQEALIRKSAEEKRYWELYDQRKRDEERYARQYSEKKGEAARLDAGSAEARRLARTYQEARRAAAADVPAHEIAPAGTAIDEGTINRAREQRQRVRDGARLREEAVPRVALQLDAVAQLADDKVGALAAGQERFSVADAGTVARKRYRRTLLGQ